MSIHIKTKPRVRYSNIPSTLLLTNSSWRGYKRHSTGCQANMVLQLDSGGHSLSTFNNSSTAVTPASTDLQMSDVIHVVSGKTTLVNTSQPMITNNVDSMQQVRFYSKSMVHSSCISSSIS